MSVRSVPVGAAAVERGCWRGRRGRIPRFRPCWVRPSPAMRSARDERRVTGGDVNAGAVAGKCPSAFRSVRSRGTARWTRASSAARAASPSGPAIDRSMTDGSFRESTWCCRADGTLLKELLEVISSTSAMQTGIWTWPRPVAAAARTERVGPTAGQGGERAICAAIVRGTRSGPTAVRHASRPPATTGVDRLRNIGMILRTTDRVFRLQSAGSPTAFDISVVAEAHSTAADSSPAEADRRAP